MSIAARYSTKQLPYEKADQTIQLRPHAFVEIYEVTSGATSTNVESNDIADPTEPDKELSLPIFISLEDIENQETRERIVMAAQKSCEQYGLRTLEEIEQEIKGIVELDKKMERESEELTDYRESSFQGDSSLRN